MLFGKGRKEKKRLDDLWFSMEMNLKNNYKDMAKDALTEYEKLLEQYKTEDRITENEYERRIHEAKAKRNSLVGYGHDQHIGW